MNRETPFDLRLSTLAGQRVVVTVAGEIDMSTAEALAEALESVPAGTRAVVVELTNVSFLDSSALNVLVRSQRHLADRGIPMSVVSPSGGAVHKVFEITRLAASLNVVDSLEVALRA